MKTKTIDIDLGVMPHSWNEMSEKQVRRVIKAMLSNMDVTRFRLEMLRLFTDLLILQKPDTCRNRSIHFLVKFPHQDECFLSVDAIRDMGASFDWLLEPSDLWVQKLPKLMLKKKRILYGPDSGLCNITFNEYISANDCYEAYMMTKDIKYLDQLVAVLYRAEKAEYNPLSPDNDGDRREKFNPFTYEPRAKQVSKLDIISKTIILFYYTGCRRELQNRFPDVFNGHESGGVKKGIPGLAGLVSRLNDGDPTKNESIRNTYLYDILEELQKNEELSEKMKSK